MRNEIPRIAEGKYLKMLYDLHEKNGTLHISDVRQICSICDMENECKKEGTEGKLTAFCLEGIFKE